MAAGGADADGDGEISFHEFVEVLTGRESELSRNLNMQLRTLRYFFSLLDPAGEGLARFQAITALNPKP